MSCGAALLGGGQGVVSWWAGSIGGAWVELLHQGGFLHFSTPVHTSHATPPMQPTPAESAAKARADKSVAVRRAIGQLVSLSLPDTPINVAAFLAGSVAALATALVPYYTGLVIDYASIEPDRCVCRERAITLPPHLCAWPSHFRAHLQVLTA